MIKKILLAMLMASLMFSIQISIIGCEDKNDDDSGPDVSGSADQFTPSNDYMVKARLVGIDFGFGGLSACADIEITKDGSAVEDAFVMVNSDTIPYDFGVYQASLTTSNSYELTITHDGNLIASGSGAKPPEGIPVITNLDSGDVHQINSDLTVEWGSVSGVTSWQVTSNTGGYHTYESSLLPLDADSHVIPGTYFPSGGGIVYDVQVSGINGLYPGDDAALADPLVGYDIEGPKGYFIGITQSDEVEIFVND